MGQQVGIWVDYNADFLLKRNQYSSQIPQKNISKSNLVVISLKKLWIQFV